MNYGYLFSSELQKMAWGFNSIHNAVDQVGGALNRVTKPRMQNYIASNPEAQDMIKAQDRAEAPKPKRPNRNLAWEKEYANYQKQNLPDLGGATVSSPNLGIKDTQFNPPKLTTYAPQQQNQDQFRPQRGPTGAGPGGRFTSPQL